MFLLGPLEHHSMHRTPIKYNTNRVLNHSSHHAKNHYSFRSRRLTIIDSTRGNYLHCMSMLFVFLWRSSFDILTLTGLFAVLLEPVGAGWDSVLPWKGRTGLFELGGGMLFLGGTPGTCGCCIWRPLPACSVGLGRAVVVEGAGTSLRPFCGLAVAACLRTAFSRLSTISVQPLIGAVEAVEALPTTWVRAFIHSSLVWIESA